MTIKNIAQQAKITSWKIASIDTSVKNKILERLSEELSLNFEVILNANRADLQEAERLVSLGELSESLYKRLALTENKFKEMVQGVTDVIKLPDPVGKVSYEIELDEGLILKRVACPIGVVGVIFEARPDVIIQISSLAIKSANAVILKGGSEAINTNQALMNIIDQVLAEFKQIPQGAVNLITTREEVKSMLELDDYIDLLIPRGSNQFVKYIQSNTRIPVLGHSEGICHIYIDKDTDLEQALLVCLDAKIDYPAACNAVETLLVHKEVADGFLPEMVKRYQANNVEVRCEQQTIDRLKLKHVNIATNDDWSTEYSDLIVSIKEVSSLEDAIGHINRYGSRHTDCIMSNNKKHAERFMNLVDSASVYWNASTRFADGYRYGLGAEVGISTNNTHARGPVGLEGLMIYKYKLYGNGHIVSDYSKGKKSFTHKLIITT